MQMQYIYKYRNKYKHICKLEYIHKCKHNRLQNNTTTNTNRKANTDVIINTIENVDLNVFQVSSRHWMTLHQ